MQKFSSRHYCWLYVMCMIICSCGNIYADGEKQDINTRPNYLLLKNEIYMHGKSLAGQYVIGMHKGKYTLVAENEKGFYYLGKGDCMYRLLGKTAYNFLKTGQIKTPLINWRTSSYKMKGGLWIPKSRNANPELFYLMSYTPPEVFDYQNGLVVSEKKYFGNAFIASFAFSNGEIRGHHFKINKILEP